MTTLTQQPPSSRQWSDFQPIFQELCDRALTPDTTSQWLVDWTAVTHEVDDLYSRLSVATTVDTTDEAAEAALNEFLDTIFEPYQLVQNQLQKKLLASGFSAPDLVTPLAKMKADDEAFCEANLELQTDEQKLGIDYDKIIGAQTVVWEGEEITLSRLSRVQVSEDRGRREAAWRAEMTRKLEDRASLNALWAKFLANRVEQAQRAGFGGNFTALTWKRLHRFDYQPSDCVAFHQAIEDVVVPVAKQIYERRRQKLGLDTLRPWDLSAPFPGEKALAPFTDVKDLIEPAKAIFDHVDPELGAYYRTMCSEGLLDLGNRKGKAPGGYCTSFPVSKRPFIFMNAVGSHGDVQTLLHEVGHAFHVFETSDLPYHFQPHTGSEVAEVASMAMELLSAPYLTKDKGGYYTLEEAHQARTEHIEKCVLFWPYMAVVDAFQHWVYANPTQASDASACDDCWSSLWDRFMVGVDWTGFDDEKATGWHRKLHIYQVPFYYIEYGLAQMGAFQVWRNAQHNQAEAVKQYRSALQKGGTVSIPEFFRTAGATFALNAETMRTCMGIAQEFLGL